MANSAKLTTNGIDIGANELITRSSVNRNVAKLLENDKALYEQYIESMKGVAIGEYMPYSISNLAYQYGDIVWFRDVDNNIWLLKCISSDNSTSPGDAIRDLDGLGHPMFEKYGWKDMNKSLRIQDVDIESYIRNQVGMMILEHETDRAMHRFGKISTDSSSPDFIDNKVLRSDVSNSDPDRKQVFYPYMTGHFQDDTILNGLYRVWDCGIIEFDIVFRVGFSGRDAYGKDIYECNNMDFKFNTASTRQKKDYQENSMYFMTEDDSRIFIPCEKMKTYEHVDVNSVQKNRTKYVNTYFGTLELFKNPIIFSGNLINKFSSLDYMIFSGDNVSCGNSATRTARCLDNQISWCNKTPSSVTAVLVTYPDGDNLEDYAKNGGLFSNSFGCHIIGKWK